MPRKQCKTEGIIQKLREAEFLLSQGKKVGETELPGTTELVEHRCPHSAEGLTLSDVTNLVWDHRRQESIRNT